MSSGDPCECLSEMGPEFEPRKNDVCNQPCAGDPNQFCGIDRSAPFYVVYVATCLSNQKRFGDYCYEAIDYELDILGNTDVCVEKVIQIILSYFMINRKIQTKNLKIQKKNHFLD